MSADLGFGMVAGWADVQVSVKCAEGPHDMSEGL